MESEDDLDDRDNLNEYDELIMPGEEIVKNNFLWTFQSNSVEHYFY